MNVKSVRGVLRRSRGFWRESGANAASWWHTQHACCDCMGQAERAWRLGLTMVKLNENKPLCMRACARVPPAAAQL